MYYCCGISEKGNVREKNEDAFLINRLIMGEAQLESSLTEPFIIAVADGVGGEKSGEKASRLCLELLSDIKFNKKTDLRKQILRIHERIKHYGQTHKGCLNMQTTLCALAMDEDGGLHSINVGDSRLYLYRSGELRQITTDQSLVQMLYDAGRITAYEKRTHARRNVIMPAMGSVGEDPRPDILEIGGGMEHGDLFLLCSDGLSDYVPTDEIEDILAEPYKLTRRLKLLTERAMERGGRDNITVLALSAHAAAFE